MLLPHSILQQIANPAMFQDMFMNYIKKAKLPFDNDKTIATMSLFHQKQIQGTAANTYFDGTFDADNTNLSNSFRRAQSEHFLIVGIIVYHGNSEFPNETDWERGFDPNSSSDANSVMTITNNGLTELLEYPFTSFNPQLTTKDRGLAMLSQPILWGGQTALKVDVKVKGGAVAPIESTQRIELVGIGFI